MMNFSEDAKDFLMVAGLLVVEAWLGRTDKVRAGSLLGLVVDLIFIPKKLLTPGGRMDIRKDLGGKLEEALNKLVDDKLGAVSLDALKAELHKQVDALVDKYVAGDLIDKLKQELKAKVIDLIDGEDDIK